MGRRGRCLLVFAGRNVRSSSSSSYSSFLPSGETRSITFPGHDTLSLSFYIPLQRFVNDDSPFVISSCPPPDDDDDYRERSHTRAAPRVRQGDRGSISFFLFRVSKTMDLGNETRLLYHTFIYYIYYIL